jgi:protein involved in polysaccharide export with SLBB domain
MVVLTRSASEGKPESESVVFDLASEELPTLLDGDSIRVASREEYLPTIYIEGAIAGNIVGISTSDQTVAQTNYAVLRTAYREGITVSTLLRPLKDKILASANMQQAFIIRKGQETQIMINLETLLYGIDLSEDVVLKPEDKIVIPYGSMYVFVTGEVTKSSWVGITGLTRLGDAVTPLFTRYSSIRDVKVKSADGYEKTFDLFKAERYGDLSQDPFLRAGDEIKISSFTNLVTIQGEVKRPGTYQLLPGEGLKELIDLYADGFTEKANTSRLTLLHYLSDSSPVGEKLQFDYAKFPDIKLRLYDVVTVPSLQELLPVVWFEGAVGVSSTGSSPETSQRIAYNFVPGETVSQAALNNRKLFSAVSDLASGYIIHADSSTTAIDLAKFIYDYDLTNDLPLKANDTIIVPFRQFFVSVSGAVRYPGRYPYIPKRTWEYYIGLAGGFDTDKNSGQKITIYDVKSHKVAIANREIQPEDNIVAESNSFTYNMMKISSIISTILSLTVLIINLLGL